MAINNVYFTITGDCQNTNTGAYYLTIDGTSPDYRIEFVTPSVPASYVCNGCTTAGSYIYLGPQETTFLAYNLSAGSYSLIVYDSDSPNDNYSVNINISSGSCINISGVQNTLCGLDNGVITASTSVTYGPSRDFSLYDINDNFISSATTSNDYYIFGISESLSAGTYYVIGNDLGGCTGRTESAIIKSSATLNYSLYVINNSACVNTLGKIFVSGLTGTYPYTYQWSNGITGFDNITGLTSGSYSVIITDGSGCQVTKSTIVNNADPLVVTSIQSNNPSCVGTDGDVTIYINGGSSPYFFSGSNGVTDIVFDTEYTFNNLAAGNYSFDITDAGLCNVSTSTVLLPANSFSIQNVNVVDAGCSGTGGKIQVTLVGAVTPSYTYELSGNSGVNTVTNQTTFYEFINLVDGTYTLTVSGSSPTSCIYTNTYTVNSNLPFTVSTLTTGTTCNTNNGIVEVIVSQGYTGDLNVSLNNGQSQIITTSSTTFTNLTSAPYTVTVTDQTTGCINSNTFTINSSTNVNFLPPQVINDTITVSIIQGTPPFTISWSGDTTGVLPQNSTTVTGLSAGNYIVTITDNNGCVKTSSPILITIPVVQSNTTTYGLCSNTFTISVNLIPKKISQVFFDGYVEIISGETICNLNSAVFITNVYVNNVLYTDIFYTATTVGDAMNITDDYWYNSVENLLQSIYGIGDVLIDPLSNTIVINTDCNLPGNILAGANVIIDLFIDYDITCRFCNSVFRNCVNVTDKIVVGIVNTNFAIGDIIVYNNKCYEYITETPVGLSVTTRNNPDFTAGNCAPCILSL
jgi:hypothetical protein